MIRVLTMNVRPKIIRVPGIVRVWTTLNITEDLPAHMSARIALSRLDSDGSMQPILRL